MENMIGKEILNYRIEQELGQGGMGSVYLAVNKNIDQKVAVKVLNENLAGSVVIRKKFRDEAQLLCSLDHPNIVKFLNFVENDDGVFLIMELIDGITLEDFINTKNGLIVEKRAYEVFDQILSAFAYAHKKGVVHRDIKPANIILTGDSEGNFVPKVLDFGIATIVSESTETEKGWVVGTPSYMSPEQVLGTNIDARSDIYSLGVLLHQMLTGRAPYDTTTLSELEINNKVVKDPLPRMKEFYPYISDKTQKMVDRALAKEPEKRFQSCNDFRNTLKNVLNPEPVKRAVKIAVAALALFLLGGGVWFWDYNRVKTYYYKDYAEQWGVPQGIHRLSGSEFRGRATSYRLQYRQRKLRSLAQVNSKGNILEEFEPERFDRPVNATFSYRANGTIEYALHLDQNGKVLFKKSYDEGKDGRINMFIFRYNDEYGTEKQLPKDMTGTNYIRLENESAERGNVSRFALTFDERGFVSAIHYRNVNQPVGDGEHLYGKRYERDAKGRVIKEYFLGHDDSVRASSWGLGIKQFEYDSEDNWVKAAYFAPDGSPAYNTKGGFPVRAMEYDARGNMTFSWYQNPDGALIISNALGCAGYKNEYNEAGEAVQYVFLGTDKNPMYNTKANSGHIGAQSEHDENGWISKTTYIDENGQPAVSSTGAAVIVRKLDPKGNVLESKSFDSKNQPVESGGFFKMVMEYDQFGNLLSQFQYDTNDALCVNHEGVAGQGWEYNDQNKIVKTVYYGTDKQPGENAKGIVMCKYDYSPRGDEIKRSFYEADEKTLKLNNEGVAGWKSEFENGKEIKREYFDENGQPASGYLDHAKWEALYDGMGHQTEISYFDAGGNFTKGYRHAYDERGNIVETYRMGKDKKLAQSYLIGRSKYDEHDNEIEYALYVNDTLTMSTNGYAKITCAYDDRNQETERRYYGANGNLIVSKSDGYAIRKLEYDNRGNKTKTAFFNTSEKPMEGNNGYAIAVSEFNAMGSLVRETYFDAVGKPTKPEKRVPELILDYDKWYNTNYVAYADGFGKIIVLPQVGFAIHRYEHDLNHNKISESFYDANDKPCIDTTNGVHKIEYAYNKQNHQTAIRYYDVNNKPCVNRQNNIHKTETAYDAQGNVTEERYYDVNVSLRKDGYAIEKDKYDEQNREIERAWYDYLDRPFNNSSLGGHRRVNSYDKTGVIYRTYYAVNNVITAEWKYDPRTDQWDRSDGWRMYFENTMKRLPVTLNNYTTVTAITISGNTCTITMRINFSKYDLSGEDMLTLENEGRENAEYWREDYEMPGNATLVVVGLDNAGRELYRVSY